MLFFNLKSKIKLNLKLKINHKPAMSWVSEVINEISNMSNVVHLQNSTAWAYREHNLVIVNQRELNDSSIIERTWRIRTGKTIIATGDKDMAQLVSDHIILVDTMKNTRMDRAAVIQKFGLPPELFIDYLALAGDASDNIPGVEKVGPKTAVKWLTDYKGIDDLINNLDQIKGKVGENLQAALPHLELYQKLVTIDCNLKLNQEVEDLVIQPSNDDELFEQFKDLGLHGLIKQFNIEPEQNLIREGVDYQVVLSEIELTNLIDKILLADIVAVDTETTGLNYMEAQIVGISIAIETNQAFYIPCMHDYDDAPKQLSRDYVLTQLKPWLEDGNTKKVGHNLKYDSHIFKNHNIDLQGTMLDTMLQSYILNSTATRHNLNAVSKRYLNLNTVSYEDVAGKGAKEISFSQVDLKKATYYAAEDADISLQLNQKIYPQLEEHESLLSIYKDIEAPALQVLQRVERNGVLIDEGLLSKQSKEFAITLKELEGKVHAVAETEFNLGSPKQLQEILFEKMGLPVLRKTPKGQPSTAENVLQQLAYDFPIVKDILDYRTIAKLKTTYTDKLPLMINPRTGRIHTSYHQAVTATGRLSSSDPNLQNIPIRRTEGRRIREAFVVSEGYQMMAADYGAGYGSTSTAGKFAASGDPFTKTYRTYFEVIASSGLTGKKEISVDIKFTGAVNQSIWDFGFALPVKIKAGDTKRFEMKVPSAYMKTLKGQHGGGLFSHSKQTEYVFTFSIIISDGTKTENKDFTFRLFNHA